MFVSYVSYLNALFNVFYFEPDEGHQPKHAGLTLKLFFIVLTPSDFFPCLCTLKAGEVVPEIITLSKSNIKINERDILSGQNVPVRGHHSTALEPVALAVRKFKLSLVTRSYRA